MIQKLQNNVTKDVRINGSSGESLAAEAFARNFQSVYFNSKNSTSAKSEFEQLFNSKLSSRGNEKASIHSLFNIELIDNCIRQLKLDKASGPDDLSTEHLSNAHPALVMHLCFLFRGIALHGFMPDILVVERSFHS